jgi:hypothetical protein
VDGDAENDEPARKKPRIGGGGLFSGFNSFLPAPKRTKETAKKEEEKKAGGTTSTRKVFSLKTGAAPGFDRDADSQMLQDLDTEEQHHNAPPQAKAEDVVPKGNPMMFKPLSVGRNPTKKKKPPAPTKTTEQPAHSRERAAPEQVPPAPVSKPKVSLFGLSSEDKPDTSSGQTIKPTTYEPLVYNTSIQPPPGPDSIDSQLQQSSAQQSTAQSSAQDLESIASDLNLSQSEMRQLLGRRGQNVKGAAKILTFNTDEQYKSNAEYLSGMTEAERAAHQHKAVRTIAPGKHSLQQLVNAVSNQQDALEESFAAGKRTKKEASSKYGW